MQSFDNGILHNISYMIREVGETRTHILEPFRAKTRIWGQTRTSPLVIPQETFDSQLENELDSVADYMDRYLVVFTRYSKLGTVIRQHTILIRPLRTQGIIISYAKYTKSHIVSALQILYESEEIRITKNQFFRFVKISSRRKNQSYAVYNASPNSPKPPETKTNIIFGERRQSQKSFQAMFLDF